MDNRPIDLSDEELEQLELEKDFSYEGFVKTQSRSSQNAGFVLRFRMNGDLCTMTIASQDVCCVNENNGEEFKFSPRTIDHIEARFKSFHSDQATFDNCYTIAKARFKLQIAIDDLQFNYTSHSRTYDDTQKILKQFDNEAVRFINCEDHYLFISDFNAISSNPKDYIERILNPPHKESKINAVSEIQDDVLYANIDVSNSKFILKNGLELKEPISIEVAYVNQESDENITTRVLSKYTYEFSVVNINSKEESPYKINKNEEITIHKGCLDTNANFRIPIKT